MRVLQINVVCGVGSTGRIATDLHHHMLEKGYESHIAYGRGEARNCESIIRIGTKMDMYRHVAKTRVFDKHGFGSKRATRNFISQAEALNPDVIHLHNIHGYFLNIEILFEYLKQSKKKVIWTLHDCWSFTGHCSHFEYANCDKWKTGCFSCSEKKEYPKSLIFDNSRANYSKKRDLFTGVKQMTLVTPSNWLANLVKQSFLGEYSTHVIHNGIDLNVFKPTTSDFRKENGLEKEFIILGVASIWNYKKGFQYFLELSKQLEEDERILLLGLSEKQKRSLPSNIIGITRTNNLLELVELYSASDVFLNPTLEDTYPTTNLEALACGTPVITFPTGGSGESIGEEQGIVTKTKDLVGIKQGIEEVKKGYKDGLYQGLGYGNEIFSKDIMGQEYLEIIS